MRINGTGDDREAAVGDHGLEVSSTMQSIQHVISHDEQNAYQVSGLVTVNTTEKPVLTLKNTSPTKKVVVTYMRVTTIGAAVASATAFFAFKNAGSRSSGGTAVTPVNMFSGSPKSASVEAYESTGSDVVMNGAEVEFDRNYAANSMEKYGKEGVLVLDTNQSVTITHIGSTVAGSAYARISFYME